jgi:monomeric isocitrate dehydrogenase
MGRPKKPIDVEQVKKLAEKQWSDHQIAAFMNIDRRNLERRFAPILKEARETGRAKLIDLQWKYVLDPKRPSERILIHMCKHYLGQHDKQKIEAETKVDIAASSELTSDIKRHIEKLGGIMDDIQTSKTKGD